MLQMRKCPYCGNTYGKPPAISRIDNETQICPDCGIRQTLISIGVDLKEDQDHILDLIHEYERRRKNR